MKKTGQFYLLTAIVIIALILGYVGVSNYINKKNEAKVYDVREELNIEGNNVLEFGILNSKDISLKINDVVQPISGEDAVIRHFIALYNGYLESVGENIEVYYILGNANDIAVYKIEDVTMGSLTLNIGGVHTSENIIQKSIKKIEGGSKNEGGKVIITIEGNKYPFDLKEGENFYFIVSQTVGGDQYVETN